MRAKGVIVTLPDKEPKGVLADEAKQLQKQKQERRIVAGARSPRPVPNYLCYPEAFKDYDPKTGGWKDGKSRRVPKCRVCGDNLQPMENHKCEGFKPKYPEYTEERHRRWEEQREMIREAKRNGTFYSEDDLSGYEDEPEEDWCDEDEGDPMWE
jgi:hypothetical protein